MKNKKILSKSKAGISVLTQGALISMALLSAPVQAETEGTLLQGEYVGGPESGNVDTAVNDISEEGVSAPIAQVSTERKARPVIDKAWSEKLSKMDSSEMVRVIISLKEQPQANVSREVKKKYAAEMKAIKQDIRKIKDKYKAKRNEHAVADKENYSRKVLALGSADRITLTELNERNETLSLKIKNDMAASLKRKVKPHQSAVKAVIKGLGGKVEFSTIAVNSIIAKVPAGSVSKLAVSPKIARISEDKSVDLHLVTADNSTGVTTPAAGGGLRDNGHCGGTYDPAVMDTGTDILHPGLEDDASRTNFYSWYLSAAVDDDLWDDVLSEDDIQGHGTHVQGIVTGKGSTNYYTYRGMADCVSKAVTLKAGYLKTNGKATMQFSDSMLLVDRALYNTSSLKPFNTFNDDVDGLNLSFGGNASSDESDWGRFFDSIISTYTDLVVTISAGNSGPTNTVFVYPANNYNAITVANVNDAETSNRSDDTIAASSTRGPTLNGRRKPDIAAPGTSIGSANNNWETGADYVNKTGTSMSAPIIQGIAMDLMDAGVTDELQIKALLLNHAQKNEAGINFESDSDGWDVAYGWGYVNAYASYYHRADVVTDYVAPRNTSGDYVLYKGQMRDEGSTAEGRDRVTMAWNKHVDYNAGDFPTTSYGLTDLNLRLYAEANNVLIDIDSTSIDNVHQVRIDSGAQTTDVIVKAYAWSTSFAHGGATEEFALATEEGFVKVDLPDNFQGIASKPSELEPNEEADFEFWLRNDSEVASHTNKFELILPSGWTMVSGPAIFNAGTIAVNATSAHVIWRLRAPSTAVGAQTITARHTHDSYAEAYGPYNWNMGVNVVADVTPPSPDPMAWLTEPYESGTTNITMTAKAASDLHGPVEYYFSTLEVSGGGGVTPSGWTVNRTYTDIGLGVNHQYRYWVRARDSSANQNTTGWSLSSDEYTGIEASSGVTFSGITRSSLGARSSNTPSGLTRGTSGLILFNNTSGTNSGWKQNNDVWTSSSLSPNAQHCFTARSRNGDAALTAIGPSVCKYTLANQPVAGTFSNITQTSIQVNLGSDGNPTGTEYWFRNANTAQYQAWSTSKTFVNTGLSCGTTYIYSAWSRNGDGTNGSEAVLGDATTLACPDADGDGVQDSLDNCSVVANPAQRDTDADNYGNYCDADFDNNGIVNAGDLGYLKSKFFSTDPHADLNGDGIVNAGDLAILKSYFFKAPGPSGLVP